MSERRWVWYFSDPSPAAGEASRILLGGKGASLKDMTLAGLRVPPGFTLSTEACESYYQLERKWPDGLEQEVRENLARLEKETGRAFGRGKQPLLVSVRSGAALSMPGMMDTLLNCGLHPGLAEESSDAAWFWDVYIQFILMFSRTVAGIGEEEFAEALSGGAADRAQAEACMAIYAEEAGRPFPTEPWDVLAQCVNAVFASWHSERAVAYRQRHDIRGLRGTAVNVQAMFPSEISGILFTQNPTHLQANEIVIESSYGLGEAVVSGDVAPDRFVVSRADLLNVKTTLGNKVSLVSAFGEKRHHDPAAASLTPPQITELCGLGLKIEKYFGHPVDIEWGCASGEFALLQARAIRGLDVAQEVETARGEEIQRLRNLANGTGGGATNGTGSQQQTTAARGTHERRHVWVTHNLAETLRAPTPLTWDIVRRFMSGAGGFGRLYRQLGYTPSRRVCEDGFLELICGRIYADPDRLAELFWEGMPLAYDLAELPANKSLLDRAPTKFDANKADGLFLLRLPKNLLAMRRAARNMARERANAKRNFDKQVLPPFLKYVEQRRAQDLSKLSDEAVIAEFRARCERVLDDFGCESLKPGFYGGLALDSLETSLAQLMGEQQGSALAGTLVLGLDGDITFEQDALLYKVARGETALGDFLARFGHRCIGEMELSVPRWSESPAYIEQTVARLKAARGRNPEDIHHQNSEKRQAADAELPATLAKWGGSSFREDIERDLTDARALLPYRESGKYYLMMGYALIRAAIEELSRRWNLGGGIYFLQSSELPAFQRESEKLRDAISRRKVRWQALQRLDMPDVVDSERLDGLGLAQTLEAVSELSGTAMAPGVATGTARVVLDPQQPGELGTDYVLVCTSTDPGWTPLFLNARGLVVERGGVLSHGAIVARDFGIPAVSCPNATKLLKDGDTVRVDGNSGKVAVVNET